MNEAKFVALANKLIKKNGRTATIKKLKPSQGWKEPVEDFDVTLDRNLPMCFVPASSGGLGNDLVTEDLLARVSQVALVAPTDIDLKLHNVVIDGGVSWKIEWVQTLRPANEILLYVIGVKA